MNTKEPKTDLTPLEVIQVAHGHLVAGVSQQQLASIFGVNQGRVNEACSVIRYASEHYREWHKQGFAQIGGQKAP